MTKWTPLTTLLVAAGVLLFAQSPRNPENRPPYEGKADPSVVFARPPNVVAWETLNNGLQDSDPAHRKKAIEALGIIGAVPEAVQQVEKGLQDKDVLVRQTAAATLGG